MELLPEEVFEQMLKYLSYEKIGTLRLVNKRFHDRCGVHMISAIMKAHKLASSEREVLKNSMPRNPCMRTEFHIYLTETFLGLQDAIIFFRNAYFKFVGKELFPPVPGKVMKMLI